jgi:hypothetical protein
VVAQTGIRPESRLLHLQRSPCGHITWRLRISDRHNHHHEDGPADQAVASRLGLETSATAHCLAGCGVGEVVGVVIGVSLGLARLGTMSMTVSLGLVFGFALGMLPLFRAGFSNTRAFKQVLVAEGLS